jgi:hypothetical protein
METKTSCQTLSHYDELGNPVYKDKIHYNNLESAIRQCKRLNIQESRIKKVVPYKCTTCHKFHIGRNGKDIKDKYRKRLRRKNDLAQIAMTNISIKVLGKIDLSKFK